MFSRKIFSKIVSLAIIFFGVYLHAQAAVIIDEIMYDVPGADDGREWVEIANVGADGIDMTGWKFFENNTNHGLAMTQGNAVILGGGFAIIADNPQKFLLDWPGFSGTIFDSAFSLSNSGESLALKDNLGTIIDTISYDPSLGANGDGNTLQSFPTGWSAHAPTVGTRNELQPPANPDPPPDDPHTPPDPDPHIPPDEGNPPSDPAVPIEENTDAHVVINEIMYDAAGADNTHEWIELANLGPSSADLSNWKLFEDDTDHRLSFVRGAPRIGAADFAIVADDAAAFLADHPDFSGTVFDSTFSLSNSGEAIAVKDPASVIRDQVNYDSSRGAAGDGNTLQKFDAGFVASPPTPGMMNVLVLPQENPVNPANSEEHTIDENNSGDPPPLAPISIHEIAWMGIAGNQYGEWLELYNDADASVDLSGWKLYKNGGETLLYTLTKTIPAKGYLVIERTTGSSADPLPLIDDEAGIFGGGGLVNLPNGEFLVLKDSFGRTVASLDFSSGWPAGDNETKKTMQYFGDAWITAVATPGAENAADASGAHGASASAPSDAAPAFVETLDHDTVVQAIEDAEPAPVPDVVENPDVSGLAVSIVTRDDYGFVQIRNQTDAAVDISGAKIISQKKTFAMPENTFVAPYASVVIANENARNAGASRASVIDGNIIIE